MSWLSKFLKPESDFDRLLLDFTTGALAQTALKGVDPGWKSKWRDPAIAYGPALATAGLAALRGEKGIVPLLKAGVTGEVGKRVAGQVFGRAPSLDKEYHFLRNEPAEKRTLRGAIGERPESFESIEDFRKRYLDMTTAEQLGWGAGQEASEVWRKDREALMRSARLEEGRSKGLPGLWREDFDIEKGKWTGYDPIKIGGLATGFTYAASLYDEAEKQKRRKNLGPETTGQVRELAKSTLRDYEYAVREVEDNLNLTDEQKAEQVAALQIKYRISLVRKLEDLGPRGPVVAAHGGYISLAEGGYIFSPEHKRIHERLKGMAEREEHRLQNRSIEEMEWDYAKEALPLPAHWKGNKIRNDEDRRKFFNDAIKREREYESYLLESGERHLPPDLRKRKPYDYRAEGGYIKGGVANLPQQLTAAPAPAPVPASTPVSALQGIDRSTGGAQQPSMAASLENLTDEQLDKQIETIVVSELTRRGIEITREIIEMAIAKFRSDNNIPYKNEATEDYSPMTFTPRTTAESLMSGESTTPPGMEDVALAAGGGYLDRYRYGGMIDPLYEMGGFVDGPGGPKTDSIPARLSDGEFVMTAEAVDGSGGPGVMYDLMDYFESRA